MKIAILGAGILGRLLGFSISKNYSNCRISIFEKTKPEDKTCSFVSGGMLAPFCELAACEQIISDLGVESLSLWEKIVQDIEHPIFFKRNGTLVLAHKNDKCDLEKFKKNIDYKSRKCNYKILETMFEISEIEPDIEKKFYNGLLLESEGHIDNRDTLGGLLLELKKQSNVQILFSCETKIISLNKIIDENNNEYSFDLILDCRGIGDKEIRKIRGVRGEIITFENKEIFLNRPIRLIHPRFPLYIIPRANHKFLIGATNIESEINEEITIRSALELLTAIFSINSQFGQSKILEMNSQLRPTLENHKPKIFFSKAKSLVKINGLYRHGFMISPKIVELVINFVFKNKIEENYCELFDEMSELNIDDDKLIL